MFQSLTEWREKTHRFFIQVFTHVSAQPTKETCHDTPLIPAAFKPTLITWQYENWWKSAYVYHVTAKSGGSNAACFFSLTTIWASLQGAAETGHLLRKYWNICKISLYTFLNYLRCMLLISCFFFFYYSSFITEFKDNEKKLLYT